MTPWFFLFGVFFCGVVGDIAYKQWATDPAHPWVLLWVGTLAYAVNTFIWAAALRWQLPLGRGTVFLGAGYLLAGVVTGLCYGEPVTLRHGVGALLALTAIFCTGP